MLPGFRRGAPKSLRMRPRGVAKGRVFHECGTFCQTRGHDREVRPLAWRRGNVTNESDVLWILLSGRLKGQTSEIDGFPLLHGEPQLTLGLGTAERSVSQRAASYPTAWEPGESYLEAAPKDNAQSLS